MNILYIFGFKYSLKLWHQTGSKEREFRFFEALSKAGNVNFTLVTYGDLSDVNFIDKKNISVIPLFSIFKKTNSKILTFLYSLLLPFKLKKNLNNIDLIKTNQLTGSWMAILFSKILQKPLFLRTGYDAYLFARQEKKNYFKNIFFYQLTKLGLNNATFYSVTSKSDFDFINKNYKFNKCKLIYRPNWIFKAEKKSDLSNRPSEFLSVGRLERQKNFSYLIETLENLNFELDIIGEGSEKENLKILAKEKNVKVNFLDKVGYFELNELFQKYKYFVLPSLYEGNPKVLLEAMSNGCIPIVSDIANHKEIVQHNENGFIFSLNNPESLKSVFQNLQLIQNLEILSDNAQETVNINNSFEAAVLKEIDDYAAILK